MEPIVEAILNVLTIIALIAAVAFIIILLVDLVLSITNKKGSIFFRGNSDNDKSVQIKQDTTVNENNGAPQVLAYDGNEQSSVKTWDEEEAEREQRALLEGKQGMRDAEVGKEDKDFAQERREMIERRKQEFDDFDDFDSLFEEDNKAQNEEVSQPEQKTDEEFNFDDMINEINAESVTKYTEGKDEQIVAPVTETTTEVTTFEEPAQDVSSETEQTEVEEPSTEEKTETVETTYAEQPVQNIEYTETSSTASDIQELTPFLEPEIQDDEVKIEQKPIEPVVEPREITNVYELFPLEMLEERLEKLQARLKVNERDLKGNRKEYTPLARVQRRLERDQEKLRRREAIIARKKVMLYGVNNYVDIDEEKAKKLSEDLDLLDGLRLSVQHCEEVMEQNKDRFPILEKTNQILVEQNRQIKDDIAEVETAIAKLKETNE